jgi:hypothetical protein
MVKRTFFALAILGLTVSVLVACTQPEEDVEGGAAATGPFIYVASGTAYAGPGVTAATPSQTVARFTLSGTFERVVRDYTANPGDSPVGLVDYSASHILVLVDNTTGRRIELVAKDGSGYSTFLSNGTALNAVVRDIVGTSDGGVLVAKNTAIEKFNSTGTRITQGANPYVSAPGGSCATSTTLIPAVTIGPDNVILMAHAAASPNNQINLISSTGYAVIGDCVTVTEAPGATHYPTSLLYHSSGKLLAGFGNNTGPIHQIYSYSVTSTTITSPVQAFNDTSILQGISEMAEMPDGTVLISAAASTFNTIERFTLNPSTGLLARVGTLPLIGPSIFTRSVSGILVTD